MSYLFSSPSFVSIGDPYNPFNPTKDTRKNPETPFLPTNPGKKGKVKGFTRVSYVPEPYHDRSALDTIYSKKRREKMNKMKQITEPFKYSSPPQRQCGLGSFFGTIGGQFEYIGSDKKKGISRKRADSALDRRNFYTSPGKKGGYGYFGTTIEKNNIFYNKKNPYDTLRMERSNQIKKEQERMSNIPPFRTTSAPKAFFDGHGKVDSMKIFSLPEKVSKNLTELEKKRKLRLKRREKKCTMTKLDNEPFRPYGKNKGLKGTFEMFEATKSDPYEQSKRKKKSSCEEFGNRGVFKPTGKAKSGPYRSVIFGSHKMLHKFMKGNDGMKSSNYQMKRSNFFF